MSVHVLRCPNCGADLDVADSTETIRCKFCGARCHVEGHGSTMHLSLFAQQLGRIEGHAARTAAELEAMRVQQAHGLASQFQTDEALRRAAAAQEAAAQESAYAARLQSATHGAVIAASQQVAAEQELERRKVLGLRSKYTWALVGFYLALLGPLAFVALFVLLVTRESAELAVGTGVAASVMLAFLLWILSSPLWLTCYFLSRYYGRKFNSKAFLYGLKEVRVKSREQVRWERETKQIERKWKRAVRSPAGSGLGGAVVLVLVIAAGAAMCSRKPDEPAKQRETQPTPANGVDSRPPSNEVGEDGSGPANEPVEPTAGNGANTPD